MLRRVEKKFLAGSGALLILLRSWLLLLLALLEEVVFVTVHEALLLLGDDALLRASAVRWLDGRTGCSVLCLVNEHAFGLVLKLVGPVLLLLVVLERGRLQHHLGLSHGLLLRLLGGASVMSGTLTTCIGGATQDTVIRLCAGHFLCSGRVLPQPCVWCHVGLGSHQVVIGKLHRVLLLLLLQTAFLVAGERLPGRCHHAVV